LVPVDTSEIVQIGRRTLRSTAGLHGIAVQAAAGASRDELRQIAALALHAWAWPAWSRCHGGLDYGAPALRESRRRKHCMNLANQVALVTGAGQGIGKASALALAAAGAHVVAADIAGRKAEETAEAIMSLQRRALPVQADVGDLRDIDRMVRQTLDEFGQIDILLNNAGVTRRADIMELTEEDWDRIHRVNAKGVFFCLQRVAREMIPRRSGRIVNIASIAGKGYEGTSNAAYAASKGAVISLTKTAAQQLGRHNINVNSVCPGVTRTALSEANLHIRAQQEGVTVEEMERRRADVIPLKRANDPEDIAAMVVFLASAGARNITGQCFNVDGGLIPD
jgi:NAD(P)-dependent dehydrogenase (short-subunit alcohol dehydrogenase family)